MRVLVCPDGVAQQLILLPLARHTLLHYLLTLSPGPTRPPPHTLLSNLQPADGDGAGDAAAGRGGDQVRGM